MLVVLLLLLLLALLRSCSSALLLLARLLSSRIAATLWLCNACITITSCSGCWALLIAAICARRCLIVIDGK